MKINKGKISIKFEFFFNKERITKFISDMSFLIVILLNFSFSSMIYFVKVENGKNHNKTEVNDMKAGKVEGGVAC